MLCADALTVERRRESVPLPYYVREGVRAVLPYLTEIKNIYKEYTLGYMGDVLCEMLSHGKNILLAKGLDKWRMV